MDEARFVALWQRLGGASEARQVFQDLKALYDSPERHYHNSRHIQRCLEHYDEAASSLGAYAAVEMAIWCHDVVYQTGSADNEENSAKWVVARADGVLERSFIEEVSKIILATRHASAPASFTEQFMVDVDLAGLGQSWEEFFRDTQDLKKESPSKNEAAFFASQGRFLQKLADRPFIFSTSFFRDAFERSARDNIARLVEQYSSSTEQSI